MKKKLVFFIGGLNFGGMERVVFIANELLKEDYDIKIVTLYQDNADYEKSNEYYNLNVPPSKKKVLTFIKRFIRTIKMKNELKPDIVFSFGMYLNYLNILSKILKKSKEETIVGIRSYDWLTEPFVNKKIDSWIMMHADKINSVSKLIANDAEKIWGIPKEKNIVIYNPYNIHEIEEKAKEDIDDFEFNEDKYYIITMGRLSNQKGYNHLIRAFNQVSQKYNNVQLIILGNGDKKNDLKKMIEDYNLCSRVFLLGGKNNPYKYVKKANLYVLSSLTEGFPNALCEAMCIGTPVVSVNCKSGPSEILVKRENVQFKNSSFYIGDYGILSKELIKDANYERKEISESEESLASAIEFAIENDKEVKKISSCGKKHMEDFSYDKFYNKLKYILK